ncbi:MAG: FAD-dependent oxidoreductase [Adlercreutzia equolifaciens]
MGLGGYHQDRRESGLRRLPHGEGHTARTASFWKHGPAPYEAVTWWADTAAEAAPNRSPTPEREYNGYTYYLHANTYNHLEGAHNDAALAVCDAVAAEGVEFFFNSPAVQLYKEGERVAGVICETEEGNVLFKAAKGVILASGDCSGNQEMRDLLPDLRGLRP